MIHISGIIPLDSVKIYLIVDIYAENTDATLILFSFVVMHYVLIACAVYGSGLVVCLELFKVYTEKLTVLFNLMLTDMQGTLLFYYFHQSFILSGIDYVS